MCAATAKQMEISLSSPPFRVRPVRTVGPVRTHRAGRTGRGVRRVRKREAVMDGDWVGDQAFLSK